MESRDGMVVDTILILVPRPRNGAGYARTWRAPSMTLGAGMPISMKI
jgi:hypothetical protein